MDETKGGKVAKEPDDTRRNQDGRFKPGASGNPAGRPAGSRNRVTLAVEELLGDQHEELTQAAIEKALEGDTAALRLCLDRIAPTRKDSPVTIELPKVETVRDAVEASQQVLAAVAAGEVTPDEAGRVLALLTAHKALVEAGDIEGRVAALEAKQ